MRDKPVTIPLSPLQARDLGWHQFNFEPDLNFVSGTNQVRMILWCAQTHEATTYCVFSESVWFYKPEDLLLCKLRWS